MLGTNLGIFKLDVKNILWNYEEIEIFFLM